MKAGILSDTHDDEAAVSDALAFFAREGVDLVIHLGDVCRPSLIERICGNGRPVVGVFGNNDTRREELDPAAARAFRPGPQVLEVGGRRILMAHAFDELVGEIGEGGKFDLILFGHTHRPLTMRVGRALVLNPGEACGLVSGRRTCAVVDLDAMTSRILDIPSAADPEVGESGSGAAGGATG
jgi:uncharacterized protein